VFQERMLELKARKGDLLALSSPDNNLPEAMVARAIFGMKKGALKLCKTGGEAFEGKKIRL
jgi:hypothetical protein